MHIGGKNVENPRGKMGKDYEWAIHKRRNPGDKEVHIIP